MKKPSEITPGAVFAMPLRGGAWGACQVLRAQRRDVEVVVLDHVSDARPTLASVTRIPLTQERYAYKVSHARVHVVDVLPRDFVCIGVVEPVLPELPQSNVWAFWSSLPNDIVYERRWRAIPEPARRAWREGSKHGPPATVRLPSGDVSVPCNLHTLYVKLGGRAHDGPTLAVADASALDWRCFDALPALTSVEVSGYTGGLAAWLATRPLINTLALRDFTAPHIDLTATHVERLTLAPAGAATVRVPVCLDELKVRVRAPRQLCVEGVDDETVVSVEAWDDADLAMLEGATHVRSLTVHGIGALDLAALGGYGALRSLVLFGAPGRLRNSAHLARHCDLRTLHLRACYDVDVAHMPALSAWASLEELRAWSLHAGDTEALRAHWGRDRRVALRAPVDDAGVFATADFPVLRWPSTVARLLIVRGYAQAARKLAKCSATVAELRKALKLFTVAVARATKDGGPLAGDARRDVEASWRRLVARAGERLPSLTEASVASMRTWVAPDDAPVRSGAHGEVEDIATGARDRP